MRKEFWCGWQYECKEDAGKQSLTCTAHLAEGRVFECHYTKNNVYYNPKTKRDHGLSVPNDPDFKPAEGREGVLVKKAIHLGNIIN